MNLNFERREMAASIIVRAGQVIPALPANQLATRRLQPLGTNRAETDGVLRGTLLLAGILSNRAMIRVYMRSSFHGPKVIAQPAWSGKKQTAARPYDGRPLQNLPITRRVGLVVAVRGGGRAYSWSNCVTSIK
jgi:hypothetical protein